MITGALILTAIWVILAIAYPWYIHEPLQSMLGQNAARLGETGDYLAGWFTPLAFSWFIVTVFLQRNELKHQREELKMMRQEYSQSRIAAENQVQQLASSSLTAKQEILMQMLAQSNYSLSYNCEKIVLSVQELTGKPEANHVNNYKNQYGIIDAQVRLAVEILNDMVRDSVLKNHFYHAAARRPDIRTEFDENMFAFVRLRDILMTKAEEVKLGEYYALRRKHSIEQEIESACRILLELQRPVQ